MSRLRKSEKYIVKLTNLESFTSTFKAFVGIGILACPSAFKEIGIIGGILGLLITLTIVSVIYTELVSVIERNYDVKHRTLSEITEKVYGAKLKIIVELCIVGS